ncbi:MAG: hypothetical protein ACR2JC_03115 [Chloroflexota bacterium]
MIEWEPERGGAPRLVSYDVSHAWRIPRKRVLAEPAIAVCAFLAGYGATALGPLHTVALRMVVGVAAELSTVGHPVSGQTWLPVVQALARLVSW